MSLCLSLCGKFSSQEQQMMLCLSLCSEFSSQEQQMMLCLSLCSEFSSQEQQRWCLCLSLCSELNSHLNIVATLSGLGLHLKSCPRTNFHFVIYLNMRQHIFVGFYFTCSEPVACFTKTIQACQGRSLLGGGARGGGNCPGITSFFVFF